VREHRPLRGVQVELADPGGAQSARRANVLTEPHSREQKVVAGRVGEVGVRKVSEDPAFRGRVPVGHRRGCAGLLGILLPPRDEVDEGLPARWRAHFHEGEVSNRGTVHH
jgi:hypothetical protein